MSTYTSILNSQAYLDSFSLEEVSGQAEIPVRSLQRIGVKSSP